MQVNAMCDALYFMTPSHLFPFKAFLDANIVLKKALNQNVGKLFFSIMFPLQFPYVPLSVSLQKALTKRIGTPLQRP